VLYRQQCCNGRVTGPLVFTPGAAARAFDAVAAVWFVFEAVMGLLQRWRARSGVRNDPTFWVLYVCIAGSVLLSQALGRSDALPWPGGRLWPVVAGLVLIVAGVALRAWSIITLGRFFQYQIRIQAGHTVVTNGPYRFVRHPSYTGVVLAIAGYALATGDVYSLVAALALSAAGLAVRIRAEERQLCEALGDDYAEFAAHRKRLIPGVL
jgi:protein-S-isoprenylcysteine O-methyltransferase Ste14